jgi:uncharacterized BrkB/YihY/UPF0761 family membrane protein
MTADSSATETLRSILDQEKRRDRLVRRICVASWAITIFLVLVFAALVVAPLPQMIKAVRVGVLPWSVVMGAAMPLVGALWILSVLVAALSTIGVFLRFRSASLAEIQLRLAALEDMLAARS